MKILKILVSLISISTSCAAYGPIGFGKDTTGGEGGTEYHVTSYIQLLEALKNQRNPNGPKIIYIDSSINGLEADDGHILKGDEITKEFNLESYSSCFTDDGKVWRNTTYCENIEKFRIEGSEKLKYKIKIKVNSNTTIIGGKHAKLEELSLRITDVENVIIKDLYIKAPVDYFSEWDPNDGEDGDWNSEFDGIVISNSKNVWIDNCYLTDGDRTPDTYEKYFNKLVEIHDGLIDIVNKSDLITISNTRFENHRKSILIGNNDSKYNDREKLRITLYNNVFYNCGESVPRVRFGKVHLFNNYYYIKEPNEYTYDLKYYIGLGKESNIFSEYNSFNYIAENNDVKRIIRIINNDTTFYDIGSKYNGNKINLNEIMKEKVSEENIISFSSDAFKPNGYYKYNANKDLNAINDLPNQIPSWISDINSEIYKNNLNSSGNSLIKISKINFLIILMAVFTLINII